MIVSLKEFSKNLISLSRYSKRSIAIITDTCLCVFSTWLAFVLRLEELILFKEFLYPALLSAIIAIPIFWMFGLYRTMFRYTDLSIVLTILASTFLYGLIYFLIVGVYTIQSVPYYIGEAVPRSIGALQPMLLFFAIIILRLLVKHFLNDFYTMKKNKNLKKNVLIYGAGDAGRQLVVALENSHEFKVVGFLDDNKELHRRVLLGQIIYSPLNLNKILKLKNVSMVFLALPSISRTRRNQIIQKINNYNLIVKTLPSISEIVDGRISVSDIKELNIEDLLNRDQVEPDLKLLNKNIKFKKIDETWSV